MCASSVLIVRTMCGRGRQGGLNGTHAWGLSCGTMPSRPEARHPQCLTLCLTLPAWCAVHTPGVRTLTLGFSDKIALDSPAFILSLSLSSCQVKERET